MENNYQQAVDLLAKLISTPSISREEEETATIIEKYLIRENIEVNRYKNNVWAKYTFFDDNKPTLLLNSHHDTVMPSDDWTLSPFEPVEKNGKLYGLGSNDAGGALVALITVFIHFSQKKNLNYNIIFAASAEEEVSGKNGIEYLLPQMHKIDIAIVGEPTEMKMAIAEKGLLVLDCIANGKSGHAARSEGKNAIYEAINDIEWLRNYSFPRKSSILGDVKATVTQIDAGQKHNIVPGECRFVVDARTTEKYSNTEVFEIIRKNFKSTVKARSFRLNSSSVSPQHPLVKRGVALGLETYGSPTMSDMAMMPFQSMKIGPGASERSHTADEFIVLNEIKSGIDIYTKLLDDLIL